MNLLPPPEKQNLKLEENLRLIAILGILSLFFLISLILVLFSLKIYLWGEVESQKIFLSQIEKESGIAGIQELEKKIDLLNKNLSKLDSFYKEKLSLTEILERISQTLPPGIYLNSLSLNPPQKTYKFQVSLSGFSPTRELLVDFKKNLEKEEDFKEINFSPSSWMEPEDIDFNLNFVIQ